VTRFPLVREPDGALEPLYREISAAGFGQPFPINWFTSQGIRPDILKGTWGLVRSLLVEGELPATLKQMIAMVISKQNGCHYCQTTHTRALNAMGVPQAQIDSCAGDPELRDIPEPQRSVLMFAVKAARTPPEVNDDDFAKLGAFGLSEGEIMEAGMLAAMTNFINVWAELSDLDLDRDEK